MTFETEPDKDIKPGKNAVARCPVCGRPREATFAPFCSRRCSDVDLSRWMTGSYAIAGAPIDEDPQE